VPSAQAGRVLRRPAGARGPLPLLAFVQTHPEARATPFHAKRRSARAVLDRSTTVSTLAEDPVQVSRAGERRTLRPGPPPQDAPGRLLLTAMTTVVPPSDSQWLHGAGCATRGPGERRPRAATVESGPPNLDRQTVLREVLERRPGPTVKLPGHESYKRKCARVRRGRLLPRRTTFLLRSPPGRLEHVATTGSPA
jgi:hypothetical protein